MSAAAAAKIARIALDVKSIVRWSPEIEHERDVAIFDLLEDNSFTLKDGFAGPYALVLSLRESTLVLDLAHEGGGERVEITLGMRSLRGVIKDYFMICESYFAAIKGATAARIEAIDMARRGLHDEGAEQLADILRDKIEVDRNTARRLFTLICVLHLRG